MVAQGHRTVPHTDLRVEAWAPTREECVAETVCGLVESFADVARARPRRTVERHVSAGSDEDLLVAVLDEVIYAIDADGEVPVSVSVRAADDGGVNLVLSLAEVGAVQIVGAVPKAASFHELWCAADSPGRWSSSVTIDV